MKTLFFCNLRPMKMGSFEILIEEIGKNFKTVNNDLVLVLPSEPIPEVMERWSAVGIRLRMIPEWSDEKEPEHPWKFCLPALGIVGEEKPDVGVIHFGNELPSVVVSLFTDKKVIWVWQQDQQIRDPDSLTRKMSKIKLLSLLRWRFVAVYDGGKASMIRRNVPSGQITTIYSGVRSYSPTRDKGWLRDELGVSRDSTICICVASLITRKRIDSLLKAFATLRCGSIASAPVLLVVGEGGERGNLEKLADTLGITNRVHFLGLRQDVAALLCESDIYVHTSLAETCTYAVLESMAAGIPAVVTEAGAAREQIVSGETGYVVEKNDLSGFVSCLSQLLKDVQLRSKMGIEAKKRWSARYRVENTARQYCELYRNLAGRTNQSVS